MTHLSQNNLRLTKKKIPNQHLAITHLLKISFCPMKNSKPVSLLRVYPPPLASIQYPVTNASAIISREIYPKTKKKPSRCRMQLQDYAILGMALVLAIEL